MGGAKPCGDCQCAGAGCRDGPSGHGGCLGGCLDQPLAAFLGIACVGYCRVEGQGHHGLLSDAADSYRGSHKYWSDLFLKKMSTERACSKYVSVLLDNDLERIYSDILLVAHFGH